MADENNPPESDVISNNVTNVNNKRQQEAQEKVYVEWPEELDDDEFRFVESRIGDLEINTNYDEVTSRLNKSNPDEHNDENIKNMHDARQAKPSSQMEASKRENSNSGYSRKQSQHTLGPDNEQTKEIQSSNVVPKSDSEPENSESRTKSNVPPLDLVSRSSSLDMAGAKGSIDINLRSDSEDEDIEKYEPQDSLDFEGNPGQHPHNAHPSLNTNHQPQISNQFQYDKPFDPNTTADLAIHQDFYDTGRNPPDSNASVRSKEFNQIGGYKGDLMRYSNKGVVHDHGGYHGGGVITQPPGHYNYQSVQQTLPLFDSQPHVQPFDQAQTPLIQSYLMDYQNNNYPQSGGQSEVDQYAKITPTNSEKRQESNSAPPQVWHNVQRKHEHILDHSKHHPLSSKNFIEANKDAVQRGIINASYATNSSYNKLYRYTKQAKSVQTKPKARANVDNTSSVATDSGKYRQQQSPAHTSYIIEENRLDMYRPSQKMFPAEEMNKPYSETSNQMTQKQSMLGNGQAHSHHFDPHSYATATRGRAVSSESQQQLHAEMFVYPPNLSSMIAPLEFSDRFSRVNQEQLSQQYPNEDALVYPHQDNSYLIRSQNQAMYDEQAWRKMNDETAARNSRRFDPKIYEQHEYMPTSPTSNARGHQKIEAIPRYSPLPPIQSPHQDSVQHGHEHEQGSYMMKFLREKEPSPPRYHRYTLKDFQNFQNINKMGGLGPNVDTDDYKSKREKFHRQREYAHKVLQMNRNNLQKTYRQTREDSPTSPQRNSQPSMVQPAWIDPKLNPPGRESPRRITSDTDNNSGNEFSPDIIEIMNRPTKRQLMQEYSKSLRKSRPLKTNKGKSRSVDHPTSNDKPTHHPQVFSNEQLEKLLMRHEDDKRNAEVIRQTVSKA